MKLLRNHRRAVARARFVTDVQAILQDALRLRDRHLDGRVSEHGLAVARGS